MRGPRIITKGSSQSLMRIVDKYLTEVVKEWQYEFPSINDKAQAYAIALELAKIHVLTKGVDIK